MSSNRGKSKMKASPASYGLFRNQATDITENESIKEIIFRMLSLLLILLCPIFLLCCFRVIKQYQRAIILRFGKVRSDSPAGPGIIWTIPCTDALIYVDLRTQSYNLPSQEILTKDSVTVLVEAVAYFHVQHPLQCFLNVERYISATQLLSVATLRHTMGQYTLTDLLSNRVNISNNARLEIDQVTMQWGVEMERVEIKDIILPHELQKAMASEAEGTRIGKAKIIEAEGEIQAAVNLRDASRIMAKNPQIMLLRYLQTLNFIASESLNTIVFPFPMETPNQGSSSASC